MSIFLFIEVREIECSVINDIRRRGLSPVLFTSRYLNESHFCHGIDLQLFDGVYYVDTFDTAAMLDCIRHNGMPVVAVLGSYDEVMIPATELAQALRLPSPCVDGLRCAFNKDQARTRLHEQGYALPLYRFFSLDSTPLLPPIPFPFIIKPIRAADVHSRFICRTGEHYRQAIADMTTKGSRGMPGTEHRHFLMEQFIDGPCYGAELLYNDGGWRVVAIGRLFMSAGDRPRVTGICQPSDLEPTRLAVASAQILGWVDALGLRGGALTLEFIYAADGPVLIDINLRIADAHVIKLVELTTGINMMTHLVDFACGDERPLIGSPNARYAYVADAFIFSPCAERLTGAHIDNTDRYFVAGSIKLPPANSTGMGRGSGTVIIGHVMAHGESCQQAMGHAENLVRRACGAHGQRDG